eukprot:743655_1
MHALTTVTMWWTCVVCSLLLSIASADDVLVNAKWDYPASFRLEKSLVDSSVVVVGTDIYLFGGKEPTGLTRIITRDKFALQDVWKVQDLSFERGPSKRSGAGLTTDGERYLYMTGGTRPGVSGGEARVSADLWRFSIGTGKWEIGGESLFSPRTGAAVFMSENFVYIFGGTSSSVGGGQDNVLGDMIRIDVSTFGARGERPLDVVELTADPEFTAPPARTGARVVAIGSGKFMMYSGYVSVGGGVLADAWVFHASDERWESISTIGLENVVGQAGYAMCRVQTKHEDVIIAYGGACCTDEKEISKTLAVYSPKSGTWADATADIGFDLAEQRLGASCASIGNKLFFFGGSKRLGLPEMRVLTARVNDEFCVRVGDETCRGSVSGLIYNNRTVSTRSGVTVNPVSGVTANPMIGVTADPMSGVTVRLYRVAAGKTVLSDNVRTSEQPVAMAITDQSGRYRFDSVPVGRYAIFVNTDSEFRFQNPTSRVFSLRDEPNVDIPMAAEGIACATNDNICGNIYGRIYVDHDEDGEMGDGEVGIGNVVVKQTTFLNGTEIDSFSVETSKSGRFAFRALDTGMEYRISVASVPSRYQFSSKVEQFSVNLDKISVGGMEFGFIDTAFSSWDGLALLGVLLLLVGFVFAGIAWLKSPVHANMTAPILLALRSFDFITNAVFVVQLRAKHVSLFGRWAQADAGYVFGVAVMVIWPVVHWLCSLTLLLAERKRLELRRWLKAHRCFAVAVLTLSATSVDVLMVMWSRLCGLRVFTAPVSDPTRDVTRWAGSVFGVIFGGAFAVLEMATIYSGKRITTCTVLAVLSTIAALMYSFFVFCMLPFERARKPRATDMGMGRGFTGRGAVTGGEPGDSSSSMSDGGTTGGSFGECEGVFECDLCSVEFAVADDYFTHRMHCTGKPTILIPYDDDPEPGPFQEGEPEEHYGIQTPQPTYTV